MTALGWPWLARLEERPARVLALLSLASLVLFVATIPLPRVDGMLIGSDGIGYYVIVRSIVIDHDLNFANEVQHLVPDANLAALRTPTGLTANQYAVGPALLWMPFFVAAHLISLGLHTLGLPVATDGYSYLYQAAVCVGSIVYGSAGMALVYLTARRWFARTALTACILIWLATNFVYYLVIEPSMSHMVSFFSTSLLLYLWVRSRATVSPGHAYLVGLAGGLVGLVRQPDMTLVLLPLLDYALSRQPMATRVKHCISAVAGVLSLFWIQMLVWQILNGSPVLSGYFLNGDQGFSWLSPHLFGVLFSAEHGLFLWHPILLFATIGLMRIARIDHRVGVLLLAGIVGQAYLIAAWSSWSQADAFGGRMFIASLPLFTVGLAGFLEAAASSRRGRYALLMGSGLLVLWNGLFLVQYRLGYISMAGPYTLQQLTIGKLDMAVDLVKRIAAIIR